MFPSMKRKNKEEYIKDKFFLFFFSEMRGHLIWCCQWSLYPLGWVVMNYEVVVTKVISQGDI